MTNSNATTTRNVLCDLPDFPGGTVTFSLKTYFAAEATEGFPQKEYSLTLSASGTGTQALAVPSTGAWLWEVGLPDGNTPLATLAAGADIQLTAWLAAALSTETANELTDSFVLKGGDTMTGLLTLSGAPTADLHAATKKYVDDNAGGVSDVDDLTTATGTSGDMVRVAVAGGLEYQTAAAVLSTIGAEPADATILKDADIDVTVQGFSAKTAAIAALTWAANNIIMLTGAGTAAVQALAAHVVTFLGSATAADARTAIGAGTGNGDLLAANNLSEVTAATARTNLAVPGLAGTNSYTGLQVLGAAMQVGGFTDPVGRFIPGDQFRRALLIAGATSQSVHLLEVRASVAGTLYLSISENGYIKIRKQAAPVDAELDNGDMAIWFDQTTPALAIKAKKDDGTILTGSVTLS